MVGISLGGWARDMGNSLALVEVWEAAVFKHPGCSSKVWGGFTHVGSITDSMCHAQLDCLSNCLAIVWED